MNRLFVPRFKILEVIIFFFFVIILVSEPEAVYVSPESTEYGEHSFKVS